MEIEQRTQIKAKRTLFYIEHRAGEKPSRFYIEKNATQKNASTKPSRFYIEHRAGEKPSKFYIELPEQVLFSLRARKKKEEEKQAA